MPTTANQTDRTVWVNNVKRARLAKGWTQIELANKVGCAYNTIGAIERFRLSGRTFMDDIATALEIDAEQLFPYYRLYTYAEAASKLGVSVAVIHRCVSRGILSRQNLGHLRAVSKEEVDSLNPADLKPRTIRTELRRHLRENGEATTEELVDIFGPFDSDEERERKLASMRSILSRSGEFTYDADWDPPRWYYANGNGAQAS